MPSRRVIPKTIRELEAPLGFSNPFTLGIRGRYLFATETLCGDWDGNLLLLAQDFAPLEKVSAAVASHGAIAAWRHNDGDGPYKIGFKTNFNLCRSLTKIGRRVDLKGEGSQACKVLYGNACFFLKDGGDLAKGVAASKPVFNFVIANMPRLRVIGCLGEASFAGVMGWLDLSASWRSQIDTRKPVRHKNLLIFALAHPGQLGVNNRLPNATNEQRMAAIEADWRAVGRALRAN